MIATERTPLTQIADPANPNFSFIRRRKTHQLRCCLWASLGAIFIMLSVMIVSYFIHEIDSEIENSTESVLVTQKLAWMEKLSPDSNETSLTDAEWQNAVEVGKKAIELRLKADAENTPLPSPSPDSRHRFAVKTSVAAGKLALGGIGELAATREIEENRLRLGKASSKGSYFKNIWIPAGACKKYSVTNCTNTKYRTYDGTCNHPENLGAALTPFTRNLPADYADGIEAPRSGKFGKSLPSAREISLKVHPPSPSFNPAFTVMLAVFGQFLDHDITATAISQGKNGSSLSCCSAGNSSHPECFPVRVGPGDPVFDMAGKRCMEFVRSAPAPQCKIGPREQLNQVSAFIDSSVIYGPDRETAYSLREFKGGLLRMYKTPDNRTLLPQSMNPNDGCNREIESLRGRYCFASGDGRANENLHLTTMHVLWARQHNLVAGKLSAKNPDWNDEKIYQESRRIVGAQMQHVAYSEFVPIVLGEKETNSRKLRPLSSGYRKGGSDNVNPGIANSFASSAFRFAHTLIPGLMKVADSQKGSSSYVELHRMLFNPYSLYAKGGVENSLKTAASNAIQRTTTHVSSQLTSHLFEDPLANTTVPCGLDLVSLNIQRGRDHGIPGYTAWRKFCGLGDVRSFEELSEDLDPEALREISKLYDNVEDIDLYTGALAEVGNGDGLIGPTFKCLVGDQFERLQQGDRFWYETPDTPQAFTLGQLNEIRKTTLAKLICDCSDDIHEIQPQVMRSVSADNPMVSCDDLPSTDLSFWEEKSIPILSASAVTPKPEVWVNFENEIKTTVNQLVDAINKTTIPRNTSWIVFKDWFSKSFADLRNEIISIRSNTTESTIVTKILIESDNGIFKNVKKTADSKGSEKYLKAPKSGAMLDPTYDDWLKLKKNVSDYLSSELEYVGIPTTKQRGELMKNLSAEFVNLRNVMNLVKTGKNAKNGTKMENLNLTKMKEEIYERATPALKKSKKDSDMPQLDGLQFSSLMDDWTDFKKKINDSLMLGSLGTTTDNDDWVLFRDSIKRKFAEFGQEINAFRSGNLSISRETGIKLEMAKNKYETKENKYEAKIADKKTDKIEESEKRLTNLTLGATPTKTPFIPAADWIAFKEEVKTSIQDFVKAVNSTEIEQWNETKDLIKNLHDDLHDKIMALKDELTKP